MSDYRDWCGSCNNEINFGSHDPDCDWLHAQRIAMREQHEFETDLRKTYNAKTDEEIIEEAAVLHDEIAALASLLRAKERKWDFIRRDYISFRLMDQLRERLGKRYI